MRFLPVRLPRRAAPVPAGTAPGEKVQAWCRTADGEVLAGTRDALHGQARVQDLGHGAGMESAKGIAPGKANPVLG